MLRATTSAAATFARHLGVPGRPSGPEAAFSSKAAAAKPAVQGAAVVVLLVQGLWAELERLRRRANDAIGRVGASVVGRDSAELLADGGGLPECLMLAELLLTSRHGHHIKRTRNGRESVLFAKVLQQKCGVADAGARSGAVSMHSEASGGRVRRTQIQIDLTASVTSAAPAAIGSGRQGSQPGAIAIDLT